MSMPDLSRSPLWREMAEAAGLIGADGAISETIYGEMTRLATRTGAINLGQGAPGTDAPSALIEATAEAMREGYNQYAPGQGHPALLEAVARQRARDFGQAVDTEEVLITCGATEGLTAAILALVPRGGTVVAFEPFYDSYPAAVAAAGGEFVTVPVLPDGDGGFQPDWEAFAAAMATGPALVIVNTPHNPTGFVFSRADLARIGEAAESADAWILTDEVYEQLVLGEAAHVPPALAVTDASRVVTVSSAGKSWNITGWKLGWVIAAPPVRAAIQAVKQFLTFTGGGPMQIGLARLLNSDDAFVLSNRRSLAERAGLLVPACESVPGAVVSRPAAGYFTVVDFSALTELDAFALNDLLAREHGLVGIPVPALCRAGTPAHAAYRSAIRYSFCKSPADVEEGAARFRTLAASLEADPDLLRR